MRKLRTKMNGTKIPKTRAASTSIEAAQRDFDAYRYAESEQAARAILADNPNHLGALELLAKVEWRLERNSDALATLQKLVTLNPFEPGYFYMRGLIYQALGQFREASDSLARAVAFEGTPMSQAATVALEDLEAWQKSLIAQLAQDDPEFRLRYAQDPAAAIQQRGFVIRARAAVAARPEILRRAVVWVDRPS